MATRMDCGDDVDMDWGLAPMVICLPSPPSPPPMRVVVDGTNLLAFAMRVLGFGPFDFDSDGKRFCQALDQMCRDIIYQIYPVMSLVSGINLVFKHLVDTGFPDHILPIQVSQVVTSTFTACGFDSSLISINWASPLDTVLTVIQTLVKDKRSACVVNLLKKIRSFDDSSLLYIAASLIQEGSRVVIISNDNFSDVQVNITDVPDFCIDKPIYSLKTFPDLIVTLNSGAVFVKSRDPQTGAPVRSSFA